MVRWLVVICALLATACVVKDEATDGTIEMRSAVTQALLTVAPDGSGHLDFTYAYLLGIVDDAGVDVVEWRFALIDAGRTEYAETVQPLREAELERDRILVEGERERTLQCEAGQLEPDRTYVLWISVYYGEETLQETFLAVRPGELYEEAFDVQTLPVLSKL
jgi:hypothetical protein